MDFLSRPSLFSLATLLAAGLAAGGALPGAQYATINSKRQLVDVSDLRSEYDFVIVGGGTSGLTVADRLSEAFPAKSVLVIEYGQVEYAPGSFDPPQLWETPTPGQAGSWEFFSQPNAIMNNQTAYIKVGKTVGGSSAVNGQFFDRGSRYDYDAWAEAYGGGSHGIKWDWKGIIPYFKKSVTFTEPPAAVAQKYGFTWDINAAYGGSTPIYSSFPPFQWGDMVVMRNAYKEIGLRTPKECAGGDKEGICWVPTSEHPVTMRRSTSGLGHYAAVQHRNNYELLTKHQVIRVVYAPSSPTDKKTKTRPPVVEVKTLADGHLFNITVKAEVIISAGAFNTPAILQRSGIGPPSFLQSAGIPLIIDSPGVGANLQDHGGPPVSWNLTKPPTTFHDTPSKLKNNATYHAEAIAAFDQTPAQGPYTLALGNTAVYISLPHIAPSTYKSIISKIRSVATSPATLSSYLPPGPDYASNPAMLLGYKSQLLALANLLSNPDAPSNESPFATASGANAWAFLLHPLSRGTVKINTTSPLAQPILDYRGGTNPLDFDIHLAHVRYLRKLGDTPTFKKYGAVELTPGAALQSDAELVKFVKERIILSFQHPCCTAAMLPREKGGVVGADLKVHGAEKLGGGLRVADMSVSPLLIGSHLSATAYAIGEKAADIIIKEWSTGGH